jgi:hypothetical protein
MFGHDNHDNDDNAQGAPMPPDPVPDTNSPIVPIGSDSTPPEPSSQQTDDAAASPLADSDAAVGSDLLDIKQHALQQLTPLVDHLDQTPEEKFRTTMMMIQGSDNQSLIKDAYGAAQQISDEKARAQALLDVVNEINYFTQHKDS